LEKNAGQEEIGPQQLFANFAPGNLDQRAACNDNKRPYSSSFYASLFIRGRREGGGAQRSIPGIFAGVESSCWFGSSPAFLFAPPAWIPKCTLGRCVASPPGRKYYAACIPSSAPFSANTPSVMNTAELIIVPIQTKNHIHIIQLRHLRTASFPSSISPLRWYLSALRQ